MWWPSLEAGSVRPHLMFHVWAEVLVCVCVCISSPAFYRKKVSDLLCWEEMMSLCAFACVCVRVHESTGQSQLTLGDVLRSVHTRRLFSRLHFLWLCLWPFCKEKRRRRRWDFIKWMKSISEALEMKTGGRGFPQARRRRMCERSGTVEAVRCDWRGVSRAFHLDSASSRCRGDIDQNEMWSVAMERMNAGCDDSGRGWEWVGWGRVGGAVGCRGLSSSGGKSSVWKMKQSLH